MLSFQPLKFKSHIAKSPKFNLYYFEISEKMVKKLGGKFRVRLLCTINKIDTFHCGLQSLGNGKGYIMLNKKRIKSLNLKDNEKVELILEPDNSDFGMEMPNELEELLNQDDIGKARFLMLTPGKQRNIIHFISSVKSQHLRIERAINLIENLKRIPKGKETFRKILGVEEQ
jgi:hypothetical protein